MAFKIVTLMNKRLFIVGCFDNLINKANKTSDCQTVAQLQKQIIYSVSFFNVSKENNLNKHS